MSAADIYKTLITLLEQQEQIKITYTYKESEGKDEKERI